MNQWQKPESDGCFVTHKLKGFNISVIRWIKSPKNDRGCHIKIDGKAFEGKYFYTVRSAKAYALKLISNKGLTS